MTEPVDADSLPDGSPRTVPWDLVALVFIPFGVLTLLQFAYAVDDPLITLRYASNLLHGYGPVFNHTERVQGFTSPLDLVVKVVEVALPGGDDLLKAKLGSLVFGSLALWQGIKLVGRLGLPPWARRVAAVLMGTSFVVVAASSNGLETSLAMWLTTILVLGLVSGRATRTPVTTGIVAGAMVLARPDAALIVAFLALAGLIFERGEPLWRRVSWALGAVIAGALDLVGGWAFYGTPLPNTLPAKTEQLSRSVHNGIKYIPETLQPHFHDAHVSVFIWVLLLTQVALAGIGALVTVTARDDGRRRYLVVAVIAQLLFILKAGGDWMGGGRFLAPVVLMVLALEAIGIAWCVARVRSARVVGPIVVASLAVLVALTVWVPNHAPTHTVWSTSGHFDDRSIIEAGHTGLHAFWAEQPTLMRCAPEGSTVATSEVGYLGYARQDLDIVDLRGLTDTTIARDSTAESKTSSGVHDHRWQSADSIIGRRLLATRPVLIISFDEPPAPLVLDGRYRLVRALPRTVGAIAPSIYVRANGSDPCARGGA